MASANEVSQGLQGFLLRNPWVSQEYLENEEARPSIKPAERQRFVPSIGNIDKAVCFLLIGQTGSFLAVLKFSTILLKVSYFGGCLFSVSKTKEVQN